MDEKRPDLRAVLRELAAEEAADAGPHVGSKRLIAYRQGTLPAAERDALQEHLSLCKRCAGLLLELRDFEAASAGGEAAGPESLRQDAWESLTRRLPSKVPAIRPVAGAGRQTSRVPASRHLYIAAAVLLLAVLGLSVWAAATIQQERQRLARLEQQLEEREEALAAAQSSLAQAERQLAAARAHPEPETRRVEELEAQVAELTAALEELRRTGQARESRDQTLVASQEIEVSLVPRFVLRGQETPESGFLQGGGAVNAVRIPAQADRFTLAVNLDDHSIFPEYRLELIDHDGQVLWTGRRPGRSLLGDAGTTVTVHGVGPGRYRLRIEGLQPDRTELLAEYLLAVE